MLELKICTVKTCRFTSLVGKKVFVNASSTRNQKKDAFWSGLKRYRLTWWIDFFTDMTINDIFKPDNELHEELFLFVFVPILQKELLMTWNSRNVIQQQRFQMV